MSTLRAIIFTGALAGLIVGLVVTVVQQFGTVPLILHAEVYEQAAEAAEQQKPTEPEAAGQSAAHEHAQEHAAGAWEPRDGLERNLYTAMFNVVDWVGFGFLLTGALVLLSTVLSDTLLTALDPRLRKAA
jgi:predicted cobalt transporter CbtA